MKKKRIFTLIILLQSVLCLGGCSRSQEYLDSQELLLFSQEEHAVVREDVAEAEVQTVSVFVCGAVLHPGVVEVPKGSRIADALELAGGFREDANREYVNLAAHVTDGEKIYFPTHEEVLAWMHAQSIAESGLVDINTADAAALCTLPGIGESRAAEIISYRERNGAFASIQELKKVDCITDSIYEKLETQIRVSE